MPNKLIPISDVKTRVVYSSPFYTVVENSVLVQRGHNGAVRTVVTEGISRRSWRDKKRSETMGFNIAKGRADKAMDAKLNGHRVWDRIKRAVDLLSNG